MSIKITIKTIIKMSHNISSSLQMQYLSGEINTVASANDHKVTTNYHLNGTYNSKKSFNNEFVIISRTRSQWDSSQPTMINFEKHPPSNWVYR